MGEKLDITFSGLWTSSNPFSKAPAGAAEIADNVVIRDPGLVQPRRGYTATVASPSGIISRVFSWQGRIMAFHNNGTLRDYSDATGWSPPYDTLAAQTFLPPDAANPVRATSAQRQFFFTTSSGICSLDSMGGTAGPAGLPAPVGLSAVTSVGTGSTINPLGGGNSCGYRAVLCRFDANNNLIQSAPSDLLVVDNPSATAACGVTVTVFLPAISSPGYVNLNGTFIQLYRTFQASTAGISAGTSTLQDECFLVQEVTVPPVPAGSTSSQTFQQLSLDQQPDTAFGLPLYTNAITGTTGSGISGGNYLPPLARDLCYFQNYLLAANTTERQTLSVQLIGTQGLAAGSTVVIAGVTYTAVSGSPSQNQFQLFTAGTAAQNVQNTAKSLVRAVTLNLQGNPGATLGTPNVTAYYVSGPNGAPGQMVFQETGIGGPAFTFSAGQDNQACWSPDLSKAAYSVTSSNNRTPGKLWWSNNGQPWGFGANNYVLVGAAEQPIYRVILVRQTVFIFKADGVFTLTLGGVGTSPFTVQPFDPGLVLLAPETAQVVSNQIFCLTNRGIVYVTEAGASSDVSSPIELDISGVQFQFLQYQTNAFAISDEYESDYIMALPDSPTTTTCNQQYVFNVEIPNWTRWLISGAVHGTFDQTRQTLVWAVGNTLWQERKTFTGADYVDPTGAFTCTYKLLPVVCGDPTVEKHFEEVVLSFRRAEMTAFNLGFDTEKPNTTAFVPQSGPFVPAWGQFAWGKVPWGQVTKNFVASVNQPQGTAKAISLGITLQVTQASVLWQLQGLSIRFNTSTSAVRR